MATSTFILLPRGGIHAHPGSDASVAFLGLPNASSIRVPVEAELPFARQHRVDVIDSIGPNGPKLAIMDESAAFTTNGPQSPLRAIPLLEYNLPSEDGRNADATATSGTAFVVECREAGSRRPIVGARVDAFADFNGSVTAGGFTDSSGRISLTLPAKKIERLFVNAEPTHWGAYRTSIPIADDALISIDGIQPVRASDTDYVRTHYGATKFNVNAGVTVGVIDTGVGPHRDINLVDGINTVTGEPSNLFEDWMGHGTHVAGLIGAQGNPPDGIRGMAPGIRIIAYRVFSPDTKTATNYAILKSMIFAAAKCDILNLSLSQRKRDVIVEEAVRDAREKGVLVVVAAGNDDRQSVAFPAAYSGAIAVAALGSESSLPPQSLPMADVKRPPTSAELPDEFIAAFSNFGREIAMVGPGVGIVSTLPNHTYGMFSGTSQAAPVVTGAAACLLSREPTIFQMDRNRTRSDAIERLLEIHCTKRGFGEEFEGFGMPNPSDI